MKKISIKDVAKDVGVSITTVSRALNGYTDVSAQTRQKVFEAAERLNYAPDINARSLGGKADTTIALLTSELQPKDENGFVYGMINGLFQQCSEQDCEFMLLVTNKAKQEKLNFLQLCKKKNLSGVVVTGLRMDDPYYSEVMESDIPCALIDMNAVGKKKCKITIDNVAAAKEAVEYLISLGHRHIGMLNGRKKADVCGERYSGYVSALLDAKIPLQLDYMRYCDFMEEKAFWKQGIYWSSIRKSRLFSVPAMSWQSELSGRQGRWDCRCRRIFLFWVLMIYRLPDMCVRGLRQYGSHRPRWGERAEKLSGR